MITIGKIIKTHRKRLGLNQEELCFGICEVSNLSKIENDKRDPSRATFEALMEKLGLSTDLYPSFLNETDKKLYELKQDFNDLYAKGDYDAADKVLDDIDGMKKLERADEHFIRMSRVLIKKHKGEPPEEVVKQFEDVIAHSIKDFAIEKIHKTPLSKTEINILNAYAVAHHKAGNTDIAIKILYQLIKWIEYFAANMEFFTIVYTKVLANLSSYVSKLGNDEEVVRLCDIGVKLCIRYDKYTYFANLLYNKGYSLVSLGRLDEASKPIQESYFIQRAMGEKYSDNLEIIKSFASKNGIKLL